MKEPERRLRQTDKDVRAEYNFGERPWLQLMCCALVSGREVGCIFQSGGKSLEAEVLG